MSKPITRWWFPPVSIIAPSYEQFMAQRPSLASTWYSMMERCYYPNCIAKSSYIGITFVCTRWMDWNNFAIDMGPHPGPKYTLDRKDTRGHYDPSNCRWITNIEQQRNKTNNILITRDGVTKTATEWAIENGLTSHAEIMRFIKRWKSGKTFEECLSTSFFYSRKKNP